MTNEKTLRDALGKIRDYCDNAIANGSWGGEDATNIFTMADDALKGAVEPRANALKCPTCKRPLETVATEGMSADPLACLHPVVMSNVTLDGSTNKWCYSCGKAL